MPITSNMTRCQSDPTLNRLQVGADSGDEATVTSESDGSEAALARARRKAARRKSRAARLGSVASGGGSTATFGDNNKEQPAVTWKEMTIGVVLIGAFGSCLTVFVLLERQQTSVITSDQECDARTLLQLKLASYIYNGGNVSAALATTEGARALGSLVGTETCGCPNAQQLDEFETIIHVLLVAALLTVVGVTILMVDDNEDTMFGSASNLMPRRLLTSTMKDLSERVVHGRQKTIADLFPETSVLFADIVGFEAWSSQREPTQCLTLLETIYDAFDRQAKTQGVFKVEAVADCYTAATGLPDARKDHAEAMAKFAHTCLKLFREATKSLEVSLGPDTSDLSLRVGIHSGPVTALRGGRSRFQLFGDTVTTAAAILNSSQAGKIQLSQETVNLLPKDLQSEWVKARRDNNSSSSSNNAKHYWLVMPGFQEEDDVVAEGDRIPRLVDWNVQILKPVLHQIVSKRHAAKHKANMAGAINKNPVNEKAVDQRLRQGKLVIDEVEEVIKLPKYDAALAKAQEEQEVVELSDQVVDQLREYIRTIAQSYKNNPFHNFAHASHVTMSVCKLLSRILAPKLETKITFADENSDRSLGGSDDSNEDSDSHDDDVDDDDDGSDYSSIDDDLKQRIHDHTYGITSDPLTQFACMFSALIHDAEHDGVPNAQLVKEETALAAKYKNQSVAEQNSVDVAWELLMQPQFMELRNAIYSNEEEMIHFRKLVVNCVMATDICDKQLKELRNNRWDRAFAPKTEEQQARPDPAVLEEDVNRKATIVIEHLLQASDVSHTMQHFHVFRKWNEKLFLEMYLAYREGRSTSDPSKFWYKGEIGFFDFYVIPLAKKLKECGVFGVSSDEYLNYATKNRQEWESKGSKIVEGLVAKAELTHARLQRNRNMDLKNSIHRIPRCASMNNSSMNHGTRSSMTNSSTQNTGRKR